MKPLRGKALLTRQHPSKSIEAYEGSVRAGKTVTSLILWVEYLLRFQPPPGHERPAFAMVGRTERTILNNLLIPLQSMMGAKRVRIVRGDGYALICGRRVNFYGADNEMAVSKIQGLTLAGAYVDEAATLPEAFFSMLYSRLSVPGAKLFLTSNPDSPSHWLLTKWLSRAALWIDGPGEVHVNDASDALDLHRYTFLMEDNAHLDAEYVRRVKRSYTGLWYRRFVLAQWVSAEGAIYGEWDPARHVRRASQMPPLPDRFWVGVDAGFNGRARAYLVGVAEIDGVDRACVWDEWRPETRLTEARQVASFKEWLGLRRPAFVYVDPAAPSFRAALQQSGVRTAKAKNDVIPGIRLTGSLIDLDLLVVSDRCTDLMKWIPGYVWDEKAAKAGEDRPKKVDDHEVDALRYALFSPFNFYRRRLDLDPITTPDDEADDEAA